MTESSRSTWLAPDDLVSTISSDSTLYKTREAKRGQAIYSQGEVSTKFYLVASGLLKICIIREDGTEVLLEFMGAKTICGEGAAFDGLPRFSSALAVEDSQLLEFDAAEWKTNKNIDPNVLMAVLQITAMKQRVLALRLEQLFSRQPETRILELFERLACTTPAPSSERALALPPLTHEQIAAMTGMTRVTVTRTLNKLRQSGEIRFAGGRFHLRPTRE